MFKNIVWIAAEKKRTEDNSVLPLWKQRHNDSKHGDCTLDINKIAENKHDKFVWRKVMLLVGTLT